MKDDEEILKELVLDLVKQNHYLNQANRLLEIKNSALNEQIKETIKKQLAEHINLN